MRGSTPGLWRRTGPVLLFVGLLFFAPPAGPVRSAVAGPFAHASASAPVYGPGCNPVPDSFPSALSIPTANPNGTFPAGSRLSAEVEFAVWNNTTPAAGSAVTFPPLVAIFPLSNGSKVQLTVPSRAVPIPPSGWSNGSLLSAVLTLRWATSFDPTRPAGLNSQLVAVMAGRPYASVALEVRWSWNAVEPNGTRLTSAPTIPSRTAAAPYLPSIFYPAPWVGSAGTSGGTVLVGSQYVDRLTGFISSTWFRIVLEWPNGTEIQSIRESTPPGNGTPFPATVPVLDIHHRLGPGHYIVHVHDRCNAIVHLWLVTAVFSPSVALDLTSHPAGCGPIRFNGNASASGTSLSVAPSTVAYSLSVPDCPGSSFGSWVSSGGIDVVGPYSRSTAVYVSSAGAVTAFWRNGSVPAPLYEFPTPIQHVFVVNLGRSDASDVLANGAFESSLGRTYASASNYYEACHPSAPNLLAETSGATWQCESDRVLVHPAENIADLSERAGLDWDAFFESMPTACNASDAYPYAAENNPFLYYGNIANNSTLCAQHDLPFSAWTEDVAAGTIPNLAYFVPDLRDGGNDTGVAHADRWLDGWLSPYLNDSWFASSVWFVVPYEGSSSEGYEGLWGGHTFFAAVSPYTYGRGVDAENASPYNLLASIEWLLGLPVGATGENDGYAGFPAMTSLFNFSSRAPLRVIADAADPSGVAPFAEAFNASVNGGYGPYQYRWEFGDGEESAQPELTHSFAAPGNYTVTLTVTDAEGAVARAAVEVSVVAPMSETVSATALAGTVPLTVSLSLAITGGQAPFSATWSFGDGSPGAGGWTEKHVYAVPGNYTVTVHTSDSDGEALTRTVQVHAVPPMSVRLALGTAQASVGRTFQATAIAAGGGGGTLFVWVVDGSTLSGDGASVEFVPSHAGPLTLSVTARDTFGDRAEANTTIPVVDLGRAPSPTMSVTGLVSGAAIAGAIGVTVVLGRELTRRWPERTERLLRRLRSFGRRRGPRPPD